MVVSVGVGVVGLGVGLVCCYASLRVDVFVGQWLLKAA
jgi:hypothetical protein